MKVETYLINLDGSDERLKSATEQLNSEQVSFTRFAAVDGRGKPLSSFKNYNDQKAVEVMGRSLISSELGCYLSHIGCLEKFLMTDSDYLIVVEDDIRLLDGFKVTVDAMLEWLHQNPDVDWYAMNLGAKKNKMSKKLFTFEGRDLVRAYYYPIRFIGMIWSRKGAEAFLDHAKEMYMPVDNLAQSWLSQNGKGLSVWPAVVKPNGLDSDIDGAAATDSIRRNDKSGRQLSYGLKKQKRMWRDRFNAVKNMIL
ncbi:glycosyltransferase family 25 protein [Acinetobacter silvestris]|uniref:Glycosyl transferase n=1 Tax=Acinetobacter silvestris TaxID=1977882 RepID=A0A1Y3CKR1_9GAMM|nr:glycosyltransferase family 25 protein [Acinetobacter silvestris]OTG67700.1 glycosyl transferase [Acinetobacter silvestris]